MTDEERELYLPAIKAFIKVLESDNLTQEEVDELVTEGEKLQVNFIKNPLIKKKSCQKKSAFHHLIRKCNDKRTCSLVELFSNYLFKTINLFVTSKIEFSNPPIFELKVLHKSQRAL